VVCSACSSALAGIERGVYNGVFFSFPTLVSAYALLLQVHRPWKIAHCYDLGRHDAWYSEDFITARRFQQQCSDANTW